MPMKKFFGKLFHSDNLAVSCIKRFLVLFCVWLWNVWSLYSLYTYPPMYVYTKLKYEAESLAIHTIFFFMVFISICLADAFWVKESGKRNVWKYIAKQIIPMIPFLVVCPVLYNVYPDKNLCNIFLAVQWLQVIITDSLVWGSVLTAGIVIFICVLFFVVPFFVVPKLSTAMNRFLENIRFGFLKNKYLKRNRINDCPIKLFFESDCDLSAHLESVCCVFNETLCTYDKNTDDDVKKIGIYFTETETEMIGIGKKGIFAVVNVSINDNPEFYDVNLLADKCIDSIIKIVHDTSVENRLENTEDIINGVLKTADAFYPKDSGLKRV